MAIVDVSSGPHGGLWAPPPPPTTAEPEPQPLPEETPPPSSGSKAVRGRGKDKDKEKEKDKAKDKAEKVKAAPPPAEGLPPPIPVGAQEACRALSSVVEQAVHYGRWEAKRQLYLLPEAAPETDLSHFHNLMDGVPSEYQSAAVVMHCMLEQLVKAATKEAEEEARVAASPGDGEALTAGAGDREGRGTPLEEKGKPDETAEGAAIVLAAAALTSILGKDEELDEAEANRIRMKEKPPRDSTPVLAAGDEITARLMGLPAGFPLPASPLEAGSLLTTLDGRVDVAAVERHYQGLVTFPGRRREGMPPQPKLAPTELDTALAPLKSQARGIPYEVIQQRLLASAFIGMLPEGAQAAHAAELLSRHVEEHLPCDIMMQVRPPPDPNLLSFSEQAVTRTRHQIGTMKLRLAGKRCSRCVTDARLTGMIALLGLRCLGRHSAAYPRKLPRTIQ